MARSLDFSNKLTNSNIARSLKRTSAFVPSVKPPSGDGLTSNVKKFAPNVGCSNLVDKIACNGTESESKPGESDTKITYSQANVSAAV